MGRKAIAKRQAKMNQKEAKDRKDFDKRMLLFYKKNAKLMIRLINAGLKINEPRTPKA